MMTLAIKWVRLRSAEVVVVAQDMRMFYTTVLNLTDAQERNEAVKTTFCFPGNIHCQTNADPNNQENQFPLPIQQPMNLQTTYVNQGELHGNSSLK